MIGKLYLIYINTLGSAANANAYVKLDNLLSGEYTFGWENGYVGCEEKIVNKYLIFTQIQLKRL